jgi:hypothetical protein
MNLAAYRKAIAAAAAGLTVLTAVLVDGAVTGAEWVQVAAAVLGPLGVWAARNDQAL